MIIEAARGGHTGVVSLLLRQPRFTETLRKQMKAQRSAVANGNQRLKEVNRLKIPPRNIPRNPPPRNGTRNNDGHHSSVTGPCTCNDGGSGSDINNQLLTTPTNNKCSSPAHQSKPDNNVHVHVPAQQVGLKHVLPAHPATPPTCNVPESNTPTCCTTVSETPPTHSPQESLLGETFSGTFRFSSSEGGGVSGGGASESVPSVPLQPHPPPAGSGYLLPSVFADSSSYITQDRMDAYLKADEILRNHMSQLDYPKQQALMSALENLMLQSEAHRANMSSAVPSSDNQLPLDNSLAPPSQGAWSFTDPSRMPQFAIGSTTVASPDKLSSVTSSPSKINNTIVSSSVEPHPPEPHPPSVFDISAASDLVHVPHSVHSPSLGATAVAPPPTLVNHGQFFQPIYTPNMGVGGGGVKQLSHSPQFVGGATPGSTEVQSLTNSFFMDDNFPVDIPPPADLLPDHVSVHVHVHCTAGDFGGNMLANYGHVPLSMLIMGQSVWVYLMNSYQYSMNLSKFP